MGFYTQQCVFLVLMREALFLLLILFFNSSTSAAQTVLLPYQNNKIPFPNRKVYPAPVGVYTLTDTLLYSDDRMLGWTVMRADLDSFHIIRPSKWIDTLLRRNNEKYPEGYVFNKDVRVDGKRYTRLSKILETTTRSFAFRDVTRLRYTIYTGTTSGCMGCILIPGFNIAYVIWAKTRWNPRDILIDPSTIQLAVAEDD